MKRLDTEKRWKFYRHEFDIPIRGSLKKRLFDLEKLVGIVGRRAFLENLVINIHKRSKSAGTNSNHHKATSRYKTSSWDDVTRWKKVAKNLPSKEQRFELVNVFCVYG